MNLKGIGFMSVLKKHFNRFTCMFARECESHVCEKSVDKIYRYVCCYVIFLSKP